MDDLDRELERHIELETEHAIADGVSPADARAAAVRLLGNRARIREDVHELSPWRSVDRFLQDLRYAVRTSTRAPIFTTAAVLTLALGIGANVAMFSIADALLLKPLPVADPERLVAVRATDGGDFTVADYRVLRDESRLTSSVIGASPLTKVAAGQGPDVQQAFAKIVSPNYFEGLGVRPALGGTLASVDPLAPTVVVSQPYWIGRLGAHPGVVGSTLTIDGAPFSIAGVAPRTFSGEAPGESPDLWTSFALQGRARYDAPGYSWLNLMARMRPGATPPQVAAEFSALLTSAHAADSGGPPKAARVEVSSGEHGWSPAREQFGGPLLVLSALVAVLFLITCTNLAGLLLARAASRQWEIALRRAIGGTSARIVRQLLTESLALAVPGAVLGLVLGGWASAYVVRLVSASVPGFTLPPGPTLRTAAFAAAAAVIAVAIFGLAPAIRALRAEPGQLCVTASRVIGRRRGWGTRHAMIAVQIALTFVLVASGLVFARTLRNLKAEDLGYRRGEYVLLGSLRPDRGYRPSSLDAITTLLRRVRAVPGVSAASLALNGPLAASGSGVSGVHVDRFTSSDPQDLRARADWVTPQYFAASGLPLLSGREFVDADDAAAPRVAIVNRAWERHYFGDRPAVGGRFTFNNREYDIVGVAADAKYTDLRGPAPRVIYFALLQGGGGPASLQVRTASTDPAALGASIRAAVQAVNPRLHADDLVSFGRQFERRVFREALLARLSGFFATLTLVLVSIAVYGTLSFAVTLRRREIAIRLALGARRAQVIWQLAREVLVVVGAGIGGGVLLASLGGRLVSSLVFGFAPTDAITLAGTAGLLLLTAVVAACVPASRAAGAAPAVVLRE